MALSDPNLFLPLAADDLPTLLAAKYNLPVEVLQTIDTSGDLPALIAHQRWIALADLCRDNILSNKDDIDFVLRRWVLRFHALHCLAAFQHLSTELYRVLNVLSTDQSIPSNVEVPFELSLYHALAPSWSQRSEETIERLVPLIDRTRDLLEGAQDDYDRQVYESRLSRLEQLVCGELLAQKHDQSFEFMAAKLEHGNLLTRHLLSTGQVSRVSPEDSKNVASMQLAMGKYAEAAAELDKVAAEQNGSALLYNNIAVAQTYEGKLDEAIGLLERVLADNEGLWKDEHFLLNLCTMYELRTDKSASKKVELLRETIRRGGSVQGVKLAL